MPAERSVWRHFQQHQEAVRQALELEPDLAVLDIGMPLLNGIEATRRIHGALPDVRVIMLTMHADAEVISEAIRAGASGYLVKDCSTDEVAESLLQITDNRQRASSRQTIVKAYKTVRGSAVKYVKSSLPALGELVQRYMSV